MKPNRTVIFLGSSLKDLREFPASVRNDIGSQLLAVQFDREPKDWKPMPSIGAGVREIRAKDVSGIYRAVYVAKIAGKVHVLHAFQKKTQKTPQRDLDLAKQRLREVA
jgi:phage-related protein